MRHVTHMNASCHTYEWVMSHKWMSLESCHTNEWALCHVTQMNEPWVMSHKWMSHESCHTNERAMSHVTQMNEPWVMSHKWMSHESCHTNKRDMSRVAHVTELCMHNSNKFRALKFVTCQRAHVSCNTNTRVHPIQMNFVPWSSWLVNEPMCLVTRTYLNLLPPRRARRQVTNFNAWNSFELDAYEFVPNSYAFARLVLNEMHMN